jgi:hypothetical protein
MADWQLYPRIRFRISKHCASLFAAFRAFCGHSFHFELSESAIVQQSVVVTNVGSPEPLLQQLWVQVKTDLRFNLCSVIAGISGTSGVPGHPRSPRRIPIDLVEPLEVLSD